MRLLFISLQLCIIGALYLLFAIPVLAAATGLAYALAAAAEWVGAAALTAGAGAAMHYSLLSLGALPAGAAPPAMLVAASSAAGFASGLFTVGIPLLATVLANLALGFLAYYRDWYTWARRLGIAATVAGLVAYLALQAIVLYAAFGQPSADVSAGVETRILSAVLALMLLWDGYFVVSLLFWFRMPRSANVRTMARCMPAMHIGLWVVLLLAWAGALLVAGTAVNTLATLENDPGGPAIAWGFLINTATIVGSAVVLLAAVPFAVNAWASGRVAAGSKKRLAVPPLLANAVVAILCLIFLPPIGVALALSTAWLYLTVEAAHTLGKKDTDSRQAASTIEPGG